MEEIARYFDAKLRVRADSVASTTTQSSGSRVLLRNRVAQLMTCVDDLESNSKLQAEMRKKLEGALLLVGKKASKPKKDQFRLILMLMLLFDSAIFLWKHVWVL